MDLYRSTCWWRTKYMRLKKLDA